MPETRVPRGDDVVVTGRGIVSPLGQDVESFGRAILAGECAIGDFSDLENRLAFRNGAPVRDFQADDRLPPRDVATMDLFSRFAATAACQALAEALPDGVNGVYEPTRIAVVIGTANGGANAIDEQYRRLYLEGQRKVYPLTLPMTMGNAPASHIARLAKARGPVFGITSACASANHAIALGLSLMRNGAADMVICGGTDANFAYGTLKAWEGLRVVSPETCRPFSRDRKGMILGEGAGVITLERRSAALARRARPLAVILGAGMRSDAADLVYPDLDGMADAMAEAVTDAGLAVDEIDYINAHGTGTLANDKLEAAAIEKVFGARVLPVSSTKSQIGHALGASGAMELLALIAGMHAGLAPPTMNFAEADPECPLDVVPNAARPLEIRRALSNSFAFGGLNVSLAVGTP